MADPGRRSLAIAVLAQAALGACADRFGIGVDAGTSTVTAAPQGGLWADGTGVSTITVMVRDPAGRPLAGQTVVLAASGSGNTVVQPLPTDAAGHTTGRLSSTVAGIKTVTATVAPGPGQVVLDDRPDVGFVAFTLAFGQPPAGPEQQDAIFGYFTVEVRDALGNVDTSDDSSVITVGLQSGAGVLAGTLARTVVAGIATFDDVMHDTAETITLRATSVPYAEPLVSAGIAVQPSPAGQLAIARASVDSLGAEANDTSKTPAVSADGRYVAFVSRATNLVPGDTNAKDDVFVHDRLTGATERVSVDSAGAQADDHAKAPAISAGGRYVVFASAATNLVPGDTNAKDDIFVHDRLTGVTARISVEAAGAEANDTSKTPAISASGRHVVFVSRASNLVPGDTNARDDVFAVDRVTGAVELASVDSAGAQADDHGLEPAISATGRFVAFASKATNLVALDTNGKEDVFVRDRRLGTTERVSVDGAGNQADDASRRPSLSADGRFVAFDSKATNLVALDTNAREDVFVHDRLLGTTERASVDGAGNQANDKSVRPALSAAGDLVAFVSSATNLVAGDTNGDDDVFVHDRSTGATRRASVDSLGNQADDRSVTLALSADGRYTAFESAATNLVALDLNAKNDVFLAPVPP